MTKIELIEYLNSSIWEDEGGDNWRYERSYSDYIYDNLTIYDDKVSLTYTDIGWGYTNYENYEFTYEEFKNWWDGNMN